MRLSPTSAAGVRRTFRGAALRRGLVYRSNQLNPISPGDMQKIVDLRLKNDFDLRTATERKARPDQLPKGVWNVWLNVLADASGAGPAEAGQRWFTILRLFGPLEPPWRRAGARATWRW